jgi:hypothetical protein
MREILNIRKEKVSGEDFEEMPLADILISYEDGMVRADYVWQAYLDHCHPEKPNRFSVARKLDKYKPKVKVNKYG